MSQKTVGMPEALVFTYGSKSLSIPVRPRNTFGDCLERFLQVSAFMEVSCSRPFPIQQTVRMWKVTNSGSTPRHFDYMIRPVFSETTLFILSLWNEYGPSLNPIPMALTVREPIVPMPTHRASLREAVLHNQ